MISYLKGKIKYKEDSFLVIDTHDVGYRVFVPIELLERTDEEEEIELYTFTYIGENRSELYGFAHIAELKFFEQLIGITGIGPKSALSILSQATVEEIKRSIIQGDSSLLTRVSGIGKKTAERILLELKGKISISEMEEKEYLLGTGVKEEVDAIDGLTSLGYSLREAREALREVPRSAATVEEKIKEALKVIGKI